MAPPFAVKLLGYVPAALLERKATLARFTLPPRFSIADPPPPPPPETVKLASAKLTLVLTTNTPTRLAPLIVT
jgi:hypothetical protein